MHAFKGFNKNLECTMGNGTFQYEIGKTYTENECKTARKGFHCVMEPYQLFNWYKDEDSRYCLVSVEGDVDEDENKLSANSMTVIRELTLAEIAAHEICFCVEHPLVEYSSYIGHENSSESFKGAVLVRGVKPRAKGKLGEMLGLMKETSESGEIVEANLFMIDGIHYLPDVWYDVNGDVAEENR